MKNIFTFILLAISTLAMAQSFPSDPGKVVAGGDPYTDIITFDKVVTPENFDGDVYWDSLANYGTGAHYSIISMDETGDYMTFDDIYNMVTRTSVGKINRITIYWKTTQRDENSKIFVYANNVAYPNQLDEIYEDGYAVGTKLGEYTFPGGANPTTVITPSKKYQYALVYGNGSQISMIKIEWNPITSYAINIGACGTGNKITIDGGINEAEAGTKVGFTLKGKATGSYEAQSYTLTTASGSQTYEIAEKDKKNSYTGSFTMPNEAVTISAVFARPAQRGNNYAKFVAGDGVIDASHIQVTSGSTITVHFTIDSLNTVIDAHTAPSTTNATISNWTYDPATATGSFRITGFDQGTTTFNVSTQQNVFSKATTTLLHVSVVPRDVMLVTQYGDKYYAAVNAITSGRLTAQEVLVQDDQVITYSTVDNLLWKVCTLNPAVRKDKEEYTIQTPDGKYLNIDLGGLGEFAYATEHEWRKNNGRFNYAGNGIVYYATDGNFAAVSLLEHPEGAKEYVNYIQAAAETLPRNLVLDQYNTVCMPYAFICPNPNVKFYSLDCYSERGDKFHFNFIEEDFTSTPSVAGRPYIVKATDANHNKDLPIYKVSEDAAFGSHRGLIGVETSTYIHDLPNYKRDGLLNVLVFYQGTLVFTETGKVGANSAYIQFEDLIVCNDKVDAPARRVVLEVEKQDAPENSEIATGIKNALNVENINWNEPVYNIMGQRVARGTKGVLIQNGQKFIAE